MGCEQVQGRLATFSLIANWLNKHCNITRRTSVKGLGSNNRIPHNFQKQ
jgi:hypothetical protein